MLEDELKEALKKKKEKEAEIKEKTLSHDIITKQKIKIKTLENELEKEVTRYDQILSKNKTSRRDIDV